MSWGHDATDAPVSPWLKDWAERRSSSSAIGRSQRDKASFRLAFPQARGPSKFRPPSFVGFSFRKVEGGVLIIGAGRPRPAEAKPSRQLLSVQKNRRQQRKNDSHLLSACFDEVTLTTKNWLGLQKQRISVVLHTAIAEQVVNELACGGGGRVHGAKCLAALAGVA